MASNSFSEELESTSNPEQKEKEDFEDANSTAEERNEDGAAMDRVKSLEKQVSIPREILVVALISLVQFTTQAGLASVVAITHRIGDHFGVYNPGILSWLTAGYSLTVGTFILIAGRLGDNFGWKRMVVIGYVWFALWTIVLGLSWYSNHVLFIFARVLQGIGPSLCLPNGLALLGALYEPGKRKNLAFAIFGGCAPAGAMTGYVLAGLFELAWWPWAFWFAGIVLGAIAVIVVFAVPDPQTNKPGMKEGSFWNAAWDLDLFAASVGILSLILFNFSWNQAPIVGWAEAYIIVVLILSVLLVPVFFYMELRISSNPLLPFSVFTTDNAFVLICVACGWATFGIWFYYLVQILQTIRGISTLLQAAYLCPVAISGMIAAVVSGRLLSITTPAWVMVGALSAFLTAVILVATLPPFQTYWAQIFVTAIIAPWGMDMSFPSATIVISDNLDKEYQGVGASLVITIVNYCISLGLGFAGTVEVNVVHGDSLADILHGYRSALHLGIGFAGLGLCIAIIFVLKCYWVQHKEKRHVDEKGDIEKQDV